MGDSYSSNSCATHITQYEKTHRIPEGLLHAISKVESGRKDETGRIVAWPWTINAQGQGYFFPTKQAAIAAVIKMQNKGIKSIDVGCMQVNLYYHPDAFRTLSEAFDPAKNVAYAAHFLARLKNERASWHTAVAHYHSANPTHHIPYRKSVLAAWHQEKKSERVYLAESRLGSSPTKHIHRFATGKTLQLVKAATHPPKTEVRRVARGGTVSHIRNVNLSSMKTQRVLRVS
ncbi:MAG: lytic transglycosylase domain-containing protein [Alphaproteobacteria bacterium]|nr:lytic transglycosylase domain-containing protein [Alphaproteobacteria bacterium]